ncbi:MAG: cell division protein FtsX [Marinicellaceae bacterium]
MIQQHDKPNPFQVYFRGHKRALYEGFTMPWKKNPIKTLMTVLTLSICFYVPLFLWTLWLNYAELKSSWQNQGTIALFVESGLDLKETGILLHELKQNNLVESAELLTENQISQQLRQDEQLSQFMALISSYDLPHQISVTIQEDASIEDIESFINAYEINPQIEYVSYDAQWINQISALTHTLLQLARISAILFIMIIMVILGNTIANEVKDHKSELRLLELMGATWAQVRRSFLYMGVFLGIYAGLLAVIFLSVGFWWLDGTFQELLKDFGINIRLHGLNVIQIVSVLFISVLVTWLAARVTLSSHMLNPQND